MSHLPPIVLIDDDADDRELLSLILRGAFGDVQILEAADAAALARVMSEGRFGLVLTEHELGWIRSGDVLRLVRDLKPDCPVVVVTRQPVERVASEVLHLQPDGLVPKTSSGLVGLPHALRAALLRLRRRLAATGPEAGYQRLLDALPVGVFVASAEGTLLDANPALARLLGYERAEDCVQRSLDDLFAEPGAAAAWRANLDEAAGPSALEVRMRRADGSAVAVRLSSWLTGAEGAAQIQGTIEERGAPAADGPRPEAPAGAPGEAEEMAYVVSHDLRQPVTQVVRYLELLGEEPSAKLGASARELLAQARGGARRLEGMIDAVLRCARIESQGETFASVDLGTVLSRVATRLAEEAAAPPGWIDADRLPTVAADEGQIEQLFDNLLHNALKFRRAEPPRVRVGAEEAADHWHLFVRDNGIGIDPKDAQRIFVMFQRLHTDAEYPGSGIGLAICRRIVARHGGRIWVESQPGQGATFHFTLAKPPGAATRPRGEN
ncbi:MAG: ATP-binding protein [Acidobacteriota bacterium]